MGRLDVVPLYLADRIEWLDHLIAVLAERFTVDVRVRAARFDPESSFDPSRGQYDSTRLLRQLLDSSGADGGRILGVTTVDLFVPVLTYVFGEAQLGGRAAIVSSHRLATEIYGMDANEPLVIDRLSKEAVHELGHTFGLVHCPDPGCVMHASTYVEEIDLKPSTFCTRCLRAVRDGG